MKKTNKEYLICSAMLSTLKNNKLINEQEFVEAEMQIKKIYNPLKKRLKHNNVRDTIYDSDYISSEV